MTEMPEKTLVALKGSVRKWEKIVEGTGSDEGWTNCPLCAKFINEDCNGCPVKDAGFDGCTDSPYDEYVADETMENAVNERDFLVSLLPKEPKP